MHPVSGKTFYGTIDMLHKPVMELLNAQCELAKKEMKDEPSDKIGSWKRAVTVADGVWMARGHFSQNFTFYVRNYLMQGILYYKHLCQRGKDNIEEPLYAGTSKLWEGRAAALLFNKMKQEGMHVVTHWQDADSTSANEVKKNFGDNVTELCGGHYTRAHFKRLKMIKQQKCFGTGEINIYKKIFPSVTTGKCKCSDRRHYQGCGCMTDAFISMSRQKLFYALVDAGKDPSILKARLEMLPHHAAHEHEWEGGQCDFNPLCVCSCGNCDGKELCCEGKKYTTRSKLTCGFHKLAYQIECHRRSEQAEDVIHTELGRGHTNQVECANGCLIRFRSKNWNLKRLHYRVSTNLGLLESNLTFMHNVNGVDYHWLPELYDIIGLPDFYGVKAYYKQKK